MKCSDGETKGHEDPGCQGGPRNRPGQYPAQRQRRHRLAAAYVRSLSGLESDSERAAAGEGLYADNCAVCHGPGGEGGKDFGAPNLADALWLYGSSEAEISRQIQAPRHGVMPAWTHRIGDDTVKKLAVFVHSLGGGE